MTSLTDTQVVTASGGLVELAHLDLTSAVVVTSTTGQNVGGSVTAVCDGSPIIVEMFCPYSVIGNYYLVSSLYVDGSFQQRVGVQVNDTTPFYAKVRLTPPAGSHTFQWSALVNASSGTFQFDTAPTTNGGPGFIRVSKIVQATQWPAVTTSTIICTSSTRPASPFEGQKIYQTDNDRELTYDSSAWVQTNSLGGWSTWTPQLYQNGNLTSTTPHARYTRIGDTAIVQAKVSATQAGVAGQQIEIRNLPYSAEAAGDYTVIGNAVYWDGTLRWQLNVETLPTATSIAFGYDSAPFAAYGGGRFGASPSKAVASGNFISFTTTYEIA